MSEKGYITVGEIAGKLEWLRLECENCGRCGAYSVQRLLDEHGPDYSLITFSNAVTADCPRFQNGGYYDQCGCVAPDLPKVFPYRPEIAFMDWAMYEEMNRLGVAYRQRKPRR